MIDKNRSGLHRRESAVSANRNSAQTVVVANARHDEILAIGSSLHRRRGASAEFLRPCLRRRAIEYRHLMTAFCNEMPCHGKPMTPRPRKETLAISKPLVFAGTIEKAGRVVGKKGAATPVCTQVPIGA